MGPDSPLLEVVVFAYNHEEFIERALTSVLAQQTSFSISIRVHDDSSNDKTAEVARRTLGRSHVAWELVEAPENRFSSGFDFYHELIAESRAQFVALLDGDDFWTDDRKLELQVGLLQRHSSAALCHHAVTEFVEGEFREVDWPPADFRTEVVPGDWLSRLNPIASSSVVLRRSMFPDRMPEGFNDLDIADYPFWALMSAGREIAYVDRRMSAYRVHEGSIFGARPRRERERRELKTRLYILESIDAPFKEAWRAGLLAAIDYWLGVNEQLAGELEERTGELEGRIDELQGQLASARRELDDWRASTSWRITAPLRALRRRFNRLGG